MEDKSARILNATEETVTRKEVAKNTVEQSQKENPSSHPGSKGGDNASEGARQGNEDPYGEFNMEAAISADDVLRAGGFGARDGISSVLPVASDSTDFEASLLDARGYEDPQTEIQRPGLGYTK